MSHLLLIGFMGAGKSTVGRALASTLGLPFVDLDQRIEKTAGKSVQALFMDGEESFRVVESAVLRSLASEDDAVVACGGGVVTRDSNIAALHELGTVIYLKVSVGESLARIGDTASRPLLAGPDTAAAAAVLLSGRESLYAAAADIVVDTEGLEPTAVVTRILSILNGEAQ
ncbi:MAG: shikimate kinase [Coriobacteriia bacterium]